MHILVVQLYTHHHNNVLTRNYFDDFDYDLMLDRQLKMILTRI